MQADFDNMEVGDYAMIANSVEIEDNAKLYYRTETEWVFITDFSGATGIQGPQGVQGIQGIQGERGIGISSLEVRDGSLYVTLTDNTQQNAGLIITDEVKQWIVNQVTDNAKSDFNTYYNGKIADFDEHTEQKTNEFDENAESLKAKVEELEKENKLIKEQIPGANASGNSIHVKDSGTLDFDWKIRGGHKQENREGYQLLESYDFTDTTINNLSCAIKEDGKIVLNGTPSKEVDIVIKKEVTYKKGTYTFVINQLPTNAVAAIFNRGWQTLNQLSTSKLKGTFTLQEDAIVRIHIYIRTESGNLNNYILEPLLYEGEYDENKAYEQYGASPSPDYPSEVETVGSNVNLCDNSKILVGVDPKDSSEKDFRTSDYIKVEYGKSYIASLYNEKKVRIGNLVYQEWNKNLEKLQQITTDTIKITNQDIAYVTVRNYRNDAEEIKNEFYYKFEESLIATPYSPYGMGSAEIKVDNGLDTTDINYKSQTKVMPIQQEMLEGDYVADVEHHEWGKYVFTGEENYVKSSNYSDDKYFCGYIDIGLSGLNMKQGSAAYCTHFKRFGMYSNILNEECINITIQFHVRILASHLTENSAEAFKSWLKSQYEAGTPVIIYYKLAEPLNLELTAEQKSIRDTKLYTYKNITNIDVSDELASIDITYKKDLDLEHEKLQNQIDEIKQLISTTETSALLLDNLQKDVEMEVE